MLVCCEFGSFVQGFWFNDTVCSLTLQRWRIRPIVLIIIIMWALREMSVLSHHLISYTELLLNTKWMWCTYNGYACCEVWSLYDSYDCKISLTVTPVYFYRDYFLVSICRELYNIYVCTCSLIWFLSLWSHFNKSLKPVNILHAIFII